MQQKAQNQGRIGESGALNGRFSCCVWHRTQLLLPHLPAIHVPERGSRRGAEDAETQPTTVRVLRGGSVTVNGGPDMRILRSALRSEDESTGRTPLP